MNHAQEQARAQYASIYEMLAAASMDWERLEELRDIFANCPDNLGEDEAEELRELEQTSGDYASQEEAESAIYEHPLSIDFRSGWTSDPNHMTAEEFQILLCTGGPAVRIMGELGFNGEPCRAWIECQDWGTPWTQYFDASGDVLTDYAQRVICL